MIKILSILTKVHNHDISQVTTSDNYPYNSLLINVQMISTLEGLPAPPLCLFQYVVKLIGRTDVVRGVCLVRWGTLTIFVFTLPYYVTLFVQYY